jgi:hypothetical protein
MPLEGIALTVALLLQQMPCSPPTIYNSIGSNIGTAEVDAIPSEQYLIVYQDIQPDSRATTDIDVGRLLDAVRKMPASRSCRWGVLDWEHPHFSLIEESSDTARRDRCIAELQRAIVALKTEFPHIRWTVWGAPELPYWVGGHLWDSASEADKSAAIKGAVGRWYKVMDCCDWLMPWIYEVYDREGMAKEEASRRQEAHREWVKAKVDTCRAYMRRSQRWIPVMPCACPFLAPNNGNKSGIPLLVKDFIELQARPAFQAGANGLALWSALDWWLPSAFAIDAPSENKQAVESQALSRESLRRAFGPANWTSISDRVRLSSDASNLVISDLREASALWRPRTRKP